MQSALNPTKLGYKIRKLYQPKNQNSDFVSTNGGGHFEYLINPVNIGKKIKSPISFANCIDFFQNPLFSTEESIKNANQV